MIVSNLFLKYTFVQNGVVLLYLKKTTNKTVISFYIMRKTAAKDFLSVKSNFSVELLLYILKKNIARLNFHNFV